MTDSRPTHRHDELKIPSTREDDMTGQLNTLNVRRAELGRSALSRCELESIRSGGFSIEKRVEGRSNEDAFFALPNAVGVFDGVGGGTGSVIASHTASAAMEQAISHIPPLASRGASEKFLLEGFHTAYEWIQEAYDQVRETSSGQEKYIATTGAIAFTRRDEHGVPYAAIMHWGDSRVYQFTHDGALICLTTDDDIDRLRGVSPQARYEQQRRFSQLTSVEDVPGDELDQYTRRNMITNALSTRTPLEMLHPTIKFVDKPADSLFIVCSDGLYENMIETSGNPEFATLETRLEKYREIGLSSKDIAVELVRDAYVQSTSPGAFPRKRDDITACVLEG